MHKNTINLVGKTFGRIHVLSYSHIQNTKAYWNCVCVCGIKKVIAGSHLRSGLTKSCGCYCKEVSKSDGRRALMSKIQMGKNNSSYKHGSVRTPFYNIYRGIYQRCNDKNYHSYKNYGGRGIKLEWKSFIIFKKDMYKSYLIHVNKYGKEQTSIDRINNSGNYSKQNTRWATKKEQSRNKRTTRFVNYNEKTMCVADWEDFLGVRKGSIQQRISTGWDEIRAITTPIRTRRKL